jgi:cholesterol oxidase
MNNTHFNAIIVGSGFGGSVMAYRLAEAGLEVCVLERGKAYPPGSFPRSPYRMRDNFWDPSVGLYGLYHFWTFHRLSALVASGLGGGSLIYANVLLRKDERWFVKEDLQTGGYEYWPITRADLDPHYDQVEQMLRPQPYPFHTLPYSDTSKTRAFWTATERLGLQPFLPGLAITFGSDGEAPVPGEPIREAHPNLHGRTRSTCRLCGECNFGCNYGSKNSLDYTYLSAAQRLGALLRTGCEVVAFEPRDGGGYTVRYREHPIMQNSASSGEEPVMHTITAERLILAAGAIGSTELLLKNRSAFPGVSGRLGTRFCGNGDLLTFAANASEQVGGAHVPRVIDPGHGPVITSAARVDSERAGGDERGFYLEDAGFPEHVTWLLQAFDLPRPLWHLILQRFLWDWFGQGKDPRLDRQISEVLHTTDLSAGVLPILAMGRDLPNGRMFLRGSRLEVDWTKRRAGPYFDHVRAMSRRIATELGARFLDNPTWFLRRLITVHPLGGCPMGRDTREGVVNSYGEVFNYPGFYIVDGAVMPGPVGANPSFTIAAIANRCADRLVEFARRVTR